MQGWKGNVVRSLFEHVGKTLLAESAQLSIEMGLPLALLH